MVIYIDKSIGKIFESRELSEKETIFFAQLAYLHRKGFGYLCGDPDSLSCLSKKFPGVEKGIYRVLGERHSEDRSIMDVVQRVLVLTFQEDYSILPHVLQKSDKVLFASLPNALNWELDQPCCLLAENQTDCNFFQHVVLYYQCKNDLNKLRCFFHCHSGGGNTTDNELKTYVERDLRLTLCVVDSDKKYGPTKTHPEPAKGGTYNRVKKASDKLKQASALPPHEFFPLDVHEVENLIPISLLRELQVDLPEIAKGVDMLDQLKDLRNGTPALYYDLKKGFPYLEPGPKRDYWREILKELSRTESSMPPEKKPEQEESEKLLFPPVCKQRLLERTNEKLNKKSEGKSEEKLIVLDTYLENQWKDLGATMFTWGCASMPYYT